MNFSAYNTAIGVCLLIILIAADYFQKYNTDSFQRKLLIIAMCAVFFSAALDFTGRFLEGRTGAVVNSVMYCVISMYLVIKNCSFYFGAAFIDYFAHNRKSRTKKLFRVFCIFLGLYAASVILNLPFGYYFTISPDNIYIQEKYYIPQLVFSFAPMLIIIIDILLAPKQFKLTKGPLVIFFIAVTALGAAFDIIFRSTSLIWPCITSAILYIYFFIIKSNSKIDTLTGIGNRYSFNEFIDKFSRQDTQENYTIAIINVDHFSDINDTYGHLEGDNALRDTAAIIKGSIRHSDFAARYRGDEFVLVTSTADNIQRIIDRIEEAMNSQNSLCVRPYQLFMSYGYDIYTTNSGRTIQDFLDHIESLMYKYKETKSCLKN